LGGGPHAGDRSDERQQLNPERMNLLMRFPIALPLLATAVLLLAACSPAPTPAPAQDAGAVAAATTPDSATEEMAADATSDDATMSEEDHADADMAEGDMAEGDMAEDDMAEGEMTEGDMVEGDMAEEEMTEETAMAEEMTDAEASQERPGWQQIALTDAKTGEPFTLADFAGKTVFVEPFATWCSNCRRQLGNATEANAQLGDEVVFVALSVEPNIGDDVLARYAENEGFDLIFAAMPPEMLQELAAIFGQTVSNPPATPHFIIRADGTVTDLVTGIEGPDAIVNQIQAEQG
jgi:thiol-disulfide isomerase/thioredoxin